MWPGAKLSLGACAARLSVCNNEQESVLERQAGILGRLFLGQIRRSRADAIARSQNHGQPAEGEYASANYEDCSIWRWVG